MRDAVRAPRLPHLRDPHADRAELQRSLQAHGVQTGIHYPIPVHLQEAYRDLGYAAGDFPHSEQAADEVLSLPMFPELLEHPGRNGLRPRCSRCPCRLSCRSFRRRPRPGLDPRRLVALMRAAVERCQLDLLRHRSVLTEAASGAYVVTPMLAAWPGPSASTR